MYKMLLDTTPEDDEGREHLVINYLAALVGKDAKKELETLQPLSGASHEVQYNYACLLTSNGRHEEALELLNASQQWHRRQLEEEGLKGAVIEKALAPVQLQKAFVLDKMRRWEEALSILTSINGASDESLLLLRDVNTHIVKSRLTPHLVHCSELSMPQPLRQFNRRGKVSFQDLTSIPELALMQKALKSTKLTAYQRGHLLWDHTLSLANDKAMTSKQKQRYRIRTWRKLRQYPLLRPLATVFLYSVLSAAEINTMAKTCHLMWMMQKLCSPGSFGPSTPPQYRGYPGIAAIVADMTGCPLKEFTAVMSDKAKAEMMTPMIFEQLAVDGNVAAAIGSLRAVQRMKRQDASLDKSIEILSNIL